MIFAGQDANQSTGDPDTLGADYVIQIIGGRAALFRWDGSDFTRRAGDRQVVADLHVPGRADDHDQRLPSSATRETLRLRRHRGLGHRLRPGDGRSRLHELPCATSRRRRCGLVPYKVKITPPTLVVRSLKPTPASPPRAGRSRSGWWRRAPTPARSSRTAVSTCVGRVGAARLTAQVQRVQGGAATCTWNIPAEREGQDVPWIGHGGLRGSEGAQSYSGRVR